MKKPNRVLIVDDEEEFRESLLKLFLHRGLKTETADRCRVAIDKLKSKDFDVVIMDVSMPEINGIQCLIQIKEQWPEVEVIILTGHASVDSGIEGMKGGAFDYCIKPIDTSELLEKIALALEKVEITRSTA